MDGTSSSGQSLQGTTHGLLVALDRQHVVTTTPADPLCGLRLGRGAQAAASARGPPVGLTSHPLLGQHGAHGVVQGGQEARRPVLAPVGAAHGLADAPRSLFSPGWCLHARASRSSGGCRGLRGPGPGAPVGWWTPRVGATPLVGPESAGRRRSGRWCAPISPSGCARRHPRDGQGQDSGQVVAHTAPAPGISHLLKNPDQGPTRQGGRGGRCHRRGLPATRVLTRHHSSSPRDPRSHPSNTPKSHHTCSATPTQPTLPTPWVYRGDISSWE